jgi:hypothetical protein
MYEVQTAAPLSGIDALECDDCAANKFDRPE